MINIGLHFSSLYICCVLFYVIATLYDATTSWRGVLPPRFVSDNPTYSCKVGIKLQENIKQIMIIIVYKHQENSLHV